MSNASSGSPTSHSARFYRCLAMLAVTGGRDRTAAHTQRCSAVRLLAALSSACPVAGATLYAGRVYAVRV